MAIPPAWYQHHLDLPLKDLQDDSQHMLYTLHTDVLAGPCWHAKCGCTLCYGGRTDDITVVLCMPAHHDMDEQTWPDRLGKFCVHDLVCIETLNSEKICCQADAFEQMLLYEDSVPDLTACLSG